MSAPLFKFSTSEGALAVLKYNSLFVTSPLDLNDPFEMRPSWTKAHEERANFNDWTRDQMAAGLPLFAIGPGGVPTPIGTVPHLNTPGPTDVEAQRGLADFYNAPVFRELHYTYRVLSFVSDLFSLADKGGDSKPEAALMWAHYGDQFQGVCIAIDPEGIENGIRVGGFRVSYHSERAFLPPEYYDTVLQMKGVGKAPPGFVLDTSSNLILSPEDKAALRQHHFIELLTKKSPAWAYESEMRMLYEIQKLKGQSHYRKVETPCHICKARGKTTAECRDPCYRDAIELPATAIRAVIFGMDCLHSMADEIQTVLDEPRYAHVERYWSAIPSTHYSVQYILGSREDVKFQQDDHSIEIAKAKRHSFFKDGATHYKAAPKGVNFTNPDSPPRA